MLFQEITKLQPQNFFINPFNQFVKSFSEYSAVFFPSFNILNIINQGKATFTKVQGYSYPLTTLNKLKGYFNNLMFGNATSVVTNISVGLETSLIIINIHLTPFERSKVERELQLKYIFNIVVEEYKKGSYVLIGGDWNMDMPITKKDNRYKSIGSSIPKDLLAIFNKDQWRLAFPETPTLRDLGTPYSDKSLMSCIDGFLLSHNIKMLDIGTVNDFRYSDHCPVVIKIKLKDNNK